jgi:hypothetical protein
MTVTNTNNKVIYVGNDVQLVFAYTFRVLEDTQMIVTITDTSVTPNTAVTLTLNQDYTISGVGNPAGGNVTLIVGGGSILTAPPTTTDNITLLREVPLTQNLDLITNDNFPSQSQEDAFDKGTFIDQQLQEQLSRAVLLAADITGVDLTLPTPEAGAPIGWNDTATGLTNNPDLTNLSQIDASANPDFIGATSGDGVLRTGSNITYTDGGDFVTLDTVQAISTASTPTFDALTLSTSLTLNGYQVTDILDEDDMVSDSNTALATQQSIRAYVLAQIGGNNEFTELLDTPAAYAGSAGYLVRVNATPDGLQFDSIATVEALFDHNNLINTHNLTTDIDHDLLTNFVANEHIDHSAVSILTAANTSGLAGGGDLTANRSLVVDIANTTAGTVASLDEVLIADVDDSDNLKRVTAQSIADLGAGGGPVQILDEGVSLTAAVSSIDFVGAGVTATNVGSAVTVTIPGGGGGATLTQAVNQTTHGFSVNDWLYHNGTIYALADASAAATAESIGIVSAVAGVDDFTIQFGGRITGLSGLTAGEAHFLSETAGQITATAPTTEGAVIKPVLIADSTTSGFIFNMRGTEITGTTSWYQTFSDGDLNVSDELVVDHNLGHQYCQIQVYNNNDKLIMPDDITLTNSNTATIDLSSYAPLTGNWKVVILDIGTTLSATNGGTSLQFVDGDLTGSGILEFTHSLGTAYPIVQVYDNNGDIVQPDDITSVSVNRTDIDLSSYQPLTGNWNAVVVGQGSVTTTVATDLQITGQTAEDIAIYDGTNWVAQGGTEKIKTINFTKDISDAVTSQPISSVGFRPSAVHFIACINGTTVYSDGHDDGTNAHCIHNQGGAATWERDFTNSIRAESGVADIREAEISSFDASGFTLNWSKVGSPTGTLQITAMCFR